MVNIWTEQNCEFVKQNFGKIDTQKIREHIQEEIVKRHNSKAEKSFWFPAVTWGGIIWKAHQFGLIDEKEKERLLKEHIYEETKNTRCGKFSKKVREQALKRDNYTCQKCGSTENLTVDHIKELWKSKEKDHSLENAQVLCKSCNSKKYHEHKREYNRDAWEKYENYKREKEMKKKGISITKFPQKGNLRNQPCPCGSGLKFKKCCWDKKRRDWLEKKIEGLENEIED